MSTVRERWRLAIAAAAALMVCGLVLALSLVCLMLYRAAEYSIGFRLHGSDILFMLGLLALASCMMWLLWWMVRILIHYTRSYFKEMEDPPWLTGK